LFPGLNRTLGPVSFIGATAAPRGYSDDNKQGGKKGLHRVDVLHRTSLQVNGRVRFETHEARPQPALIFTAERAAFSREANGG
jgi:hypothetical protein